MGAGRLCHSRAFLSLPAPSDPWRLTVNEKGKVFEVTTFVGSGDTRKEAKVLRQKPRVQPGTGSQEIIPIVVL